MEGGGEGQKELEQEVWRCVRNPNGNLRMKHVLVIILGRERLMKGGKARAQVNERRPPWPTPKTKGQLSLCSEPQFRSTEMTIMTPKKGSKTPSFTDLFGDAFEKPARGASAVLRRRRRR